MQGALGIFRCIGIVHRNNGLNMCRGGAYLGKRIEKYYRISWK